MPTPTGLHIATLLSALFLKHFPALVETGHIFVAMPPLYRIDVGKETYYALDDEERKGMNALRPKTGRARVTETRFKGLGEMNPLQLRKHHRPRHAPAGATDSGNHSATQQMMDMLLGKTRRRPQDLPGRER